MIPTKQEIVVEPKSLIDIELNCHSTTTSVPFSVSRLFVFSPFFFKHKYELADIDLQFIPFIQQLWHDVFWWEFSVLFYMHLKVILVILSELTVSQRHSLFINNLINDLINELIKEHSNPVPQSTLIRSPNYHSHSEKKKSIQYRR